MHTSFINIPTTRAATLPGASIPEPFDWVLARVLDRQADHALHLGFRVHAERLAHRAAKLREGAR